GFPAAAGRNLTAVPHRAAPAAKRLQPRSPPGLPFRLQFNAVRHSPAKTGQGCWSSPNRSELSRPDLLMRLGVTTLRGSNPRSSANELFPALRPPLGDIALCSCISLDWAWLSGRTRRAYASRLGCRWPG